MCLCVVFVCVYYECALCAVGLLLGVFMLCVVCVCVRGFCCFVLFVCGVCLFLVGRV